MRALREVMRMYRDGGLGYPYSMASYPKPMPRTCGPQRMRTIQTDNANFVHGCLLLCRDVVETSQWHIRCRREGASTPSILSENF